MDINACEECISCIVAKIDIPMAPPLPDPSHKKGLVVNGTSLRGYSCVSTSTTDMWDRLFDCGYKADVIVHTDDHDGKFYAHANIIGMASPVLKGMLKNQSKGRGRGRRLSITIRGVPHDAVRVFIRFLYSSCLKKAEMEEYVLHLLVLSHVFMVPQLKKECEQQLEQGLLNVDNVVDIFQLALLCDAPRLSIICHRMILGNFMTVSKTEGWKAMGKSHPVLEKDLLESMIDEDNRQKERIKKVKERKIYLQLHEAMEALVHICRDGCRTIGPQDKVFNENQKPCSFTACKGLELLVRHFAGCKLRVPGKCIHCKRMWQLLELHSRLCADSSACRVPLCRNFKEKMRKQSKKDEVKWRILVKKILGIRSFGGGAPFFSWAITNPL